MIHRFFALTNPAPGRENDFNRWYDNHHLREVLRYGNGFVGARRYKLDVSRSSPSAGGWMYLALYALESDDLDHFHRHAWVEDRPPLTPFTGLLADDHVAWVYTPAGPAVGSTPSLSPIQSRNLLFLLSASHDGKDRDQEGIIDTRIQDAAKRPGVLSAQRHELSEHQREHQPRPPWQHLEMYALGSSFDNALPSSLRSAASPSAVTAAANDSSAKAPVAWFFTAAGDALARSDL